MSQGRVLSKVSLPTHSTTNCLFGDVAGLLASTLSASSVPFALLASACLIACLFHLALRLAQLFRFVSFS